VSFPSWTTAVRAHTGRLLAYSLPSGEENQLQRQLIDEALAHRALPQRFRGVAPRLEGLAGTWAADPQYAVKLARVANEIRAQDL
jgi:flagellum-specific peptidoglycan hydrolase FlgJ